MPFLTSSQHRLSKPFFYFFFVTCLFLSLFTIAQITLTYRMLNGYSLTTTAPVNKEKPTLFVFEQPETFEQVFKPGPITGKPQSVVNFGKDMVVGIALPPTNKPPKLSVSKVFVQDSVLTIRYIRIADTTMIKTPQSFTTQPMLLLAVPMQTILSARLVENGKVVLTVRKHDNN